MLGKPEQIARLQSDFYRDQFRKILRWLIYVVIIMLLLIAIVFYLILSKPLPKFYANTTEGRILAMPEYK